MTTRSRRNAIPLLFASALLVRDGTGPSASHAATASPGLVGVVRASGGTPVSGSAVGLIDQANGALSARTDTSAAGEFRFDAVRPGRYRIAVGAGKGTFTSATYVATLAAVPGGDARVDWTLYPADAPRPEPRVLTAQSSKSVAGVVPNPETTTALAQPAFLADVPVWVLAAGAAGGAAGITLGSLCVSGNVLCEDDQAVASPAQ